MSLPSFVKTWVHDSNNSVVATGATLTTNRTLLLALKNALLTVASATVGYSCDSVTAGAADDGVDRWDAITDLVWSTAGARSWFVIKLAGVLAGYQLLLELGITSAPGSQLRVVASPAAGFTGGTTTARPTATDEVVVIAGQWANGSDTSYVWHLLSADDGSAVRLLICDGGAVTGFMSIETPQNQVTGWTLPACTAWVYSATQAPSYALLNDAAAIQARAPAGNMTLYLTSEGWISAMGGERLTSAPNDISAEWPLYPAGLASETAGARGRHGSATDLWWTATGLANGDTFPGDTSRTFAVFGDLVVPWDGSVPVVS